MRRENSELRKGDIYEAYKFRILNFIRNKPRHVYEIENETKIPHSSLMDCLQELKNEGWVKQLSNKEYALSTYTDLENDVRKVLDEWRKDFAGSCCIRPLTLQELMFKVGGNYENSNARVEVHNVAIKLGWIPPEISSMLVEHSRKELRVAIEGWLGRLGPPAAILGGLENLHGLGFLDVNRGEIDIRPPSEPEVMNYNVLIQHLNSGCPKMLGEWKLLCKDASNFLSLAGVMAGKLLKRVKEEARKLAIHLNSDVIGGLEGEPQVYVRNCVLLIYNALKGQIMLDLQKDVKATPIKVGNEVFYVIEPGPCMLTNDIGKAEKFATFLRKEITSINNKLEMDKIKAERQKLEQKIEEFKGLLKDLMAKIDEGLYVKGQCEKCKWLQK
jgi:hypothetical protein